MGRQGKVLVVLFAICFHYSCFLKRHKKPIEGMVYIPAGRFLMGSSADDGKMGVEIGIDEFPQHRVYLSGFYIDRFEVRNKEYMKFLEATGTKPPLIWFDPIFQHYPIQEDYPIMDVSWFEAKKYCEWIGKRLPTEEEWEKAARGTEGRKYPWGDIFDKTKCNMKVFDNNEKSWTVPVGSLPGGKSPYGVLNMCGNVSEWTASWIEAYPGSRLKRSRFGKKERVLRGGAYDLPAFFGRTADRHSVPPSLNMPMNGIRCAKD